MSIIFSLYIYIYMCVYRFRFSQKDRKYVCPLSVHQLHLGTHTLGHMMYLHDVHMYINDAPV